MSAVQMEKTLICGSFQNGFTKKIQRAGEEKMMDNKKEQERAELHRVIWNIANDLRGSVDGWDFKQYVLGMLFYRYISENLAGYINRGEYEAGKYRFLITRHSLTRTRKKPVWDWWRKRDFLFYQANYFVMYCAAHHRTELE